MEHIGNSMNEFGKRYLFHYNRGFKFDLPGISPYDNYLPRLYIASIKMDVNKNRVRYRTYPARFFAYTFIQRGYKAIISFTVIVNRNNGG